MTRAGMEDDDGPCPALEFDEHAASPLLTTATATMVIKVFLMIPPAS
jgi:hypothetical protein